MNLFYTFNGVQSIGNFNAAQNCQDIFVLSMLKGKHNGTYLEIGAGPPVEINNTFLLSYAFNWSGISLECLDQGMKNQWKNIRPKDNFIQCDALNQDYKSLLSQYYSGNVIDYLQLDIDPSINTLSALRLMPLDLYKFAVITFETDVYIGDQRARTESREILTRYGYELVVGDVLIGGKPFEDWWVHPDLVDENIYKDIQQRAIDNQDPYFLLFK